MTDVITARESLYFTTESIEKKVTTTYRKDIDGLRAIAVLSVVLYHIFGWILPGGFVGVDVFFVISGYLISSNIMLELEEKRFVLKEFYIRRVRRILPAFLFMVFVVNVAGFFILVPSDLKNMAQSSFFATLFVPNLYFWRYASIGYFNSDAISAPLLHTWSLGVEEQFYFVWPIFLSLSFNVFNKWNKVKKQISICLSVMTVFLSLVSFFLYCYLRNHPTLVFYLPVTRAFELFFGVSLAISWKNIKQPTKIQSFLYSALGLIIIIYAFIYFDSSYYPSICILFPCIGAVLLIYAGKNQNTLISKMLSWRFLTFLGLISYSLYLWHWPIIAYVNYLGVVINNQIGLIIFIASITLSFLSWRYIEQPFRYKYRFSFLRSIFLFIFIPLVIICTFIFVSPLGLNRILPYALKEMNNFEGPHSRALCYNSLSPFSPPIENCSIGKVSLHKVNALVVGDSHAMALAGMLNVMLNEAHLKGYLIANTLMPYIITHAKNNLMQRNTAVSKVITDNHFDYVILGGYWNVYSDYVLGHKKTIKRSYVQFTQGIERAIQIIEAAHSIPVIVFDVPPLLSVQRHCGLSEIGFKFCSNPMNKISQIEIITKNILLNLKNKYPNLLFIDPSRVICQNEQCVSSIQKTPLYFTGAENSHLNYSGSTLIGHIYLENFDNPFIKL